MRVVGRASLVVALLQSLCTAVLTVSGIRVAIGLTALAAASGIYAPARGFHQDAIRIPMLTLAAAGAMVNLLVLAWIWRLRAQPSAQWRQRAISPERAALRTAPGSTGHSDADPGRIGNLDPSHGSSHRAAAGGSLHCVLEPV